MADDQTRDPASEIAALAPGTVFHGVYEVVRCIKAGGMGAVYEVLQTSTQRHRALKVMLPSLLTDPDARARFELEAKIAAGIESEHIVETLDAGIDQATGMPYIVMELLKGEELGALIKARKRVSPDDVVTYMHQAALALDRTHAAGIIHRDLKPENLFLTRRDDGSPRVKILDFGVAKIVAEGSVNANSTKTVGSPMYMGPEQISGELKIGPAVDRYSLAHITFTLLVGKPYWAVERRAAEGIFPFMMQLVKGAQVPASVRAASYGVRLPETVDPWFVKATALDPAQRFESAVAMIAELAQIFGIVAPTVSLTPMPRAPLPTAPEKAAPSEPAKVAAVERAASASRQTASSESAAAAVRSDEPSLQPVTVAKSTRAWIVPSLLLVGVLGVVGAVLMWPEQKAPAVAQSSESVRIPVEPAASAVLPASSALAAPASGESSSTASTTNLPVAQSVVPGASALTAPMMTSSSRPSTAPSSKSIHRKGNDVLDQY